MAEDKKMEFRAKFDGTCARCMGPIKGYLKSGNKDTADLITWPRTAEYQGLGIAWHIRCSDIPLNEQYVAERRAKKSGEIPTEPKTIAAGEIPMETPKAETPKAPKAEANRNGNFLTGMAAALAPELVPYLDGKLSVKAQELSDDLDAKMDAKIADAVSKQSKVIVIEDRKTGERREVGRQHQQFDELCETALLAMDPAFRFCVYLADGKNGGPGSGKTSAGKALAKALGLEFGLISLNAQTADSRLMGFMAADGETFLETEFFKRWRDGGVFLIDEIDNASANLLTALNSALANGTAAFPCGNLEAHPNFLLVATANTVGRGANPMFPERRPLDAATLDRFAMIEWEYDETFERDLALAINEKAGKFVAWVQSVRRFAKVAYPKLLVSPRSSFMGASLLRKFDAEKVANMVVFRGFDKDSAARILANTPLPRM